MSNINTYATACGVKVSFRRCFVKKYHYHSCYFIQRFNWPGGCYVTADNCLGIMYLSSSSPRGGGGGGGWRDPGRWGGIGDFVGFCSISMPPWWGK